MGEFELWAAHSSSSLLRVGLVRGAGAGGFNNPKCGRAVHRKPDNEPDSQTHTIAAGENDREGASERRLQPPLSDEESISPRQMESS